jgi:hypothetical protein
VLLEPICASRQQERTRRNLVPGALIARVAIRPAD